MRYRELLLPELEVEFDNVRKTLARVPDGRNEFRPDEKSYSLSELPGHLAEMPMFVQLALTSPDVDLGAQGFEPLVMDSRQLVLAAFEERAAKLVAFMRNTSDETFEKQCELLWDDEPHAASPDAACSVLAAVGDCGPRYAVWTFSR